MGHLVGLGCSLNFCCNSFYCLPANYFFKPKFFLAENVSNIATSNKKSLIYNLKKKLGKKEKALYEGKGRPPTFKRVLKESDWKTYYGSHSFIKEANKEDLERKILQVAYNKKELTYLECKYQFVLEVLEDKKYLNDNILGKFYDRDFKWKKIY